MGNKEQRCYGEDISRVVDRPTTLKTVSELVNR